MREFREWLEDRLEKARGDMQRAAAMHFGDSYTAAAARARVLSEVIEKLREVS